MNSKQELIKFSKRLITFKSTADNPKAILACLNYIKNYLKNYGVGKIYTYQGIPSLVFQNTKKLILKPDIILSGHVDVVTPNSQDQFKPSLKNNHLSGRGSGDMKASLAAMILAFKKLAKEKNSPLLCLMITGDEELGGFNGTGYLINHKKFRAKVALVPDGGNNLEIITQEKGVIWLQITTRGKSAHASRPWEGENALVNALNLYQKIIKRFPQPKNIKEWKTSTNLARLETKNSPNQLPQEANLFLDIRHIPRQGKKSIINFIKSQPEVKNLKPLALGEDFFLDIKNKYVKKFAQSLVRVTRKKAVYNLWPASSDARFFSNKKIPAIICKPKTHDSHGPNEWIDVSSLNIYYLILVDYIKNFNLL